MSGWILFAIGMLGLAIIGGAFVYLGLKAWRLAKRGLRISRNAAPAAADVARRAETLAVLADELARNSEQIVVNLERLQRSAERLQILFEAWDLALRPYRRTREFFGL